MDVAYIGARQDNRYRHVTFVIIAIWQKTANARYVVRKIHGGIPSSIEWSHAGTGSEELVFHCHGTSSSEGMASVRRYTLGYLVCAEMVYP